MSFTIYDMDQRSDSWRQIRAGVVTASCAADILKFNKDGKESAARRDYRTQLALERIFSRSLEDSYQNADMLRGVTLEAEAIGAYEARTAQFVRRTGFILSTDLPIGVSLDADLDDMVGLLEVKAPRPANHWTNLQAGIVPTDYIPQLVHGQLVTGALWTDFCSYCPDFGPLALFIVRYERDEKAIASYRVMLERFLSEVAAEETAIRVKLAVSVAA